MPLRLIAIQPSRLPMADNTMELVEAQIGALGFARDVINDLANYPPAQPWTSRPPRTGPRAGGRRTGTLGRNWRLPSSLRTVRRGTERRVEVVNLTEYAVYVQGPPDGPEGARQTPVMAARNWPNITEVAQRRWAEHEGVVVRIITQQDPRLRRRSL